MTGKKGQPVDWETLLNSIFRGKTGAVDRYLSAKGRLTLLETVEDIATKIRPIRRDRNNGPDTGNKSTLNYIVNVIEKAAREN